MFKPSKLTGLGTLVVGATLLLGPSANALTIGPDAFGYTATDEIAFNFTDVTTTGTQTLADHDDATDTVGLGFSFNFYGTNYSQVSFSENGLMTFGGTSGAFANTNISSTDGPSNLPAIAPFWDDFRTNDAEGGEGDALYYETQGAAGGRVFIMQWNDVKAVSAFAGDVFATFQAKLFEGSNNIEFHYQDVLFSSNGSMGGSATVGIRDTDGHSNGENLQWSFNSPVLSDGQAIRFSTATVAVPVPEPGMLALFGLGLTGLGLARRRMAA